MTNTIATGEAHQAISTDVELPDPNTTITLPTEPTCEVTMSPTADSAAAGEEQIRVLAHAKWEAAGCPSGDGVDFWLEAEHEANGKRSGVHCDEV